MDSSKTPFSWSDSWDRHNGRYWKRCEAFTCREWQVLSWLFSFAHLLLALFQDFLKKVHWHFGDRHHTNLRHMYVSQFLKRPQTETHGTVTIMSHNNNAPSQGQLLYSSSKQYKRFSLTNSSGSENLTVKDTIASKTQLYDLHKVTENADGS